jgi:photosystem II stability/assembly factor-like uncharacterized protein
VQVPSRGTTRGRQLVVREHQVVHTYEGQRLVTTVRFTYTVVTCAQCGRPRDLSEDFGRCWEPEPLRTPNSGVGGQTAAGSPERACRGGNRTAISCTADGGHTWRYPIGGAENPLDGGVHVLEFAEKRHAWAIGQDRNSGSYNIVWRTIDDGDSWSSTAIG